MTRKVLYLVAFSHLLQLARRHILLTIRINWQRLAPLPKFEFTRQDIGAICTYQDDTHTAHTTSAAHCNRLCSDPISTVKPLQRSCCEIRCAIRTLTNFVVCQRPGIANILRRARSTRGWMHDMQQRCQRRQPFIQPGIHPLCHLRPRIFSSQDSTICRLFRWRTLVATRNSPTQTKH